MFVSERIFTKRKELGLTQTELAKKAGLKPPAISQYESGTRTPSYEALMKLSSVLGVTTDYLISGREIQIDSINDKTSKMLVKLIGNLPLDKKDKLLEYAVFLAQGYYDNSFHILNDAVDYADYILKSINNSDVYEIAKSLNINIYEESVANNYEGSLIKGKNKVIIINKNIGNEQRKKFIIATLIGHAVIPWHVNFQYDIRSAGSSTLLTEDIQEIEAQDFATSLIVPEIHLEEFINKRASIKTLKELAYRKYDVSLFVILNKLVKYSSNKYAVIQSEDRKIVKTIQGTRQLVNVINSKSKAAIFSEKISVVEELYEGQVPAEYWLLDAEPGEIIYEESIYNPKHGKVLTLLTY